MDRASTAKAIGDFIEAHRSEMLAAMRARAVHRNLSALVPAVEEWFNAQVDFARDGRDHSYEATARFIDAVRTKGNRIGDILQALSLMRETLTEFCWGRIPGVSDTELHQHSVAVDNLHMERIGEVYGAAERRFAAAERRRQQTIAECMDRPFVLLDSEGVVALTNSFFANRIGFAEDRILGQDFAAFCDAETGGEIRRALRAKRAASVRPFDGALMAPKGVRIPTQFSVLPMFDETGLRSGVAVAMSSGVGPGTNEHWHAGALEDLAEQLGLACYTIDDARRVISLNALGRGYVTVGAEDTGGLCCRQNLDARGDCGDCFGKRVFGTGEPYRATIQYKAVTGEMRWAEITALPLRGEQGIITRVVKVLHDVTEQKMLEHQFLRQQRTSLVSQLAMTVAHQLRNPLGVMIGFAEMLSHGMPADQMPAAIDRILRNGIRCKEIVQNLLEFGRGAPGEHALTRINDLVTERVIPACPGSSASRITWRLGDNLPLVECAPEQLVQVFINLIDNALNAARSNVVFETTRRDDTVQIKVWDDGPGVPEAIRDRIFEPFFTTRKDEGGIGLGLSLSRSVIQEHRGLLFLDESVSSGACFIIQLPAVEAAGAPAPQPKPAETPRRPGRRVLIVEDEEDLVFLLDMALRAQGYEVDTAATGAHAIELLDQASYDAIVIDMLLPDELGGGELYRLLQRTNPRLAGRALFVTGDTMKWETRRFLSDAKRPYMEKPFMISDFTKTVINLIETAPD